MKIGSVFSRLKEHPKCEAIIYNNGDADDVFVSATVILADGWLNKGERKTEVRTAHEARLFIEDSVDSNGWNGRRSRKANKLKTETVVPARTEFTLPQGFYKAIVGAPGILKGSTAKKVTVALNGDEKAQLKTIATNYIDDPKANFGLKGSAKATLRALEA